MITPLQDKILIEPIETNKTKLINPNEKLPRKGKVVRVGADVTSVKKGDIIFFDPLWVKAEELGKFNIIKEEDCYAIE